MPNIINEMIHLFDLRHVQIDDDKSLQSPASVPFVWQLQLSQSVQVTEQQYLSFNLWFEGLQPLVVSALLHLHD